MLIKAVDAEAIQAGEITALIRRWKRPQAVAGNVYQTMRGHIRATSVEQLPLADVPLADVVASGASSHDELTERWGHQPDDLVYVVRIEPCDAPAIDDPGLVSDLTDDDRAAITAKLDALDAKSPIGPWTRVTLEHIAASPGTRSADMGVDLDREQVELKKDVRKLKRLHLTRPAPDAGYEITPRGQAYLDG